MLLFHALAPEQNPCHPVPPVAMAPHLQSIARTYDLAADHFDQLPFWHVFGARTVARLALPRGGRVVDLCCGSGASALPAARAVGPTGPVTGSDSGPGLIAVARARAAQATLPPATLFCKRGTGRHGHQPPRKAPAPGQQARLGQLG